jgi:hypothetical protein
MAITDKLRNEAEFLILQVFDALDETGQNSEFLKQKFAEMSNAQFETWIKKDYPLQFQVKAFEVEPTFKNYRKAANILNINLMEPVALPYLYENKEGKPIISKPALILYIHLKKMQQMITKKNKISTDIDDRNMKTGRLNTDDKGAQTSDREMECLVIAGLTNTLDEFSTIKGDALDAKSQAYAQIAATGTLSKDDYAVAHQDSVARNLISSYLLAGHIESNLVNEEGYTPYTLKEKSLRSMREV